VTRLLIWFLVFPRLARWALYLAAWTGLIVTAIAAAPVTTVAVTGYLVAWRRGWPPARLRGAAALSLPMTAIWLFVIAVTTRSLRAVLAAPFGSWLASWHAFSYGARATAFVLAAPVAVPAGLLVASWAWQVRIYRIETGLAGATATAPVAFDRRQWRRQSKAAARANTAPGLVPLTDRKGRIVIGGTIRAVDSPWAPVLTIPASAMGRHQVIIGSSGCGKTNLMIRTWAGWYTAARHASEHGGPRPLLVVLDCKGGPDARTKAARAAGLLRAAGAADVRTWPDQDSVSLWALPPRELAVTLFQLLDTAKDGPAAYYADVTQAVVILAITAPAGPPPDSDSFLARLDPVWLERAWAGDWARLSAVRAAGKHLPDIALRYRTLLDRLGPGFDGTATLADADAWYLILEGTREPSVAQAQALAVTELLAAAATSMDAEPRSILLACDDYSAVSGKVPLWQLYERGRSLGIGVQVSAQSWHGLGADDDERYRIAATADGGIWLMRTPHPEPVAQLAGTRRVIETSAKITGHQWSDEGTSRIQHAFVADPGIARRLGTGQAGYIRSGGCTWVQVARPAVPAPSRVPVPPSPSPPAPGPVRIVPPAGDGSTFTTTRVAA
jgi:hypothetical protein